MATSPSKGKRPMTRNTAEIAREICSAIKEVYYDASRNAFRKSVADLLNLYKQERYVVINNDEYLAELEYRVQAFLDGANNEQGQYRVFKLVSSLASKALIDLEDSSIMESLTLSIHKKKFNPKPSVRKATVALIGRLLYCTIFEPKENDDLNEFYASYLEHGTFADLFHVMWHLSGDLDEDVRCEVLYGIQKLQRYPGLMVAINKNNQTAKELFVLGMRDPSVKVRCQAIKNINIKLNYEARLLLETLIHDKSEVVRFEAANKLSKDVQVAFFTKSERICFLKSKHLFLGDTIIPEYYDILCSWARDTYCEMEGLDYDQDLTPSEILTGVFHLLDSFRVNKDLHLIMSRLLEHLRKKFIPNVTGERSYISFAQLFNYPNSPYLDSTNFENILFISDNSSGLPSLNMKIKKLFMWQVLSEYCCHPSLLEETRAECRMLLLPTMVDFSTFALSFWETLSVGKEENESQRIILLQNICAKSLLGIFPVLDRDDLGMTKWKDLLDLLFADYSFQLDSELITLMVHDYFYYHYEVSKDLDLTVHALSDLMTRIGDFAQEMNCTQDLFVDATMHMNASQMPMSQGENLQFHSIDPIKRKRCVLILAAVFKCGFFLQHHTVLEGLFTNYAIPAYENPLDLETKRCAFYCVAGMVPLLDQNKHNFIKVARTVLDDDTFALEVKKVALMMLFDAISVYGYSSVNMWFFADIENDASSLTLIDKFIQLCEITELSNFVVRILLRLIILDHKKTFHEAFVYLLLRMFTPNDDEKLKTLFVYFFTTFCHHSREHQCIMANAFGDAMLKLVNVDLSKSYAHANTNEMITFVLEITSFKALHSQALDREKGSSHLYLAARLLTKIEKVLHDAEFSEYFASMLHRCEVSEVFDEKDMEILKKGCDRLHDKISPQRLKKYIETFSGKLDKAKKHSESKKAIVRPEVIPKTREELEQEFQNILNVLKSTTEETRMNKHTWLLQPLPKADDVFSKMKIFGEFHVDIEDIRRRLIGKESPILKVVTNSGKRRMKAATTPRKRNKETTPLSETPVSRVARKPMDPPSTTRSLRRRPLKEKKLNTVPEDVEEEFVD